MDAQPDIATIAAHVADRSRARILLALLDGPALPASRLAAIAGVSAPTMSGHLRRLTQAGFLAVEEDGRHRWYRIGDERVAVVVESLLALAPTAEPRGLTGHSRYARLRVARSCYDHLAGGLGTDVLSSLLERDALRRTDGRASGARADGDRPSSAVAHAPYALGPAAGEVFAPLSIDPDTLARGSRPLIRACVDWTEQRHHLAGALGAAILAAFLDREWVRRRPDRRDLQVSSPDGIANWLGSRPGR